MSIEEVFSHFQVPVDDTTNEIFTTNYTKPTIKRLKRQKPQLNARLETMINSMIQNKKYYVLGKNAKEYVSKFQWENVIKEYKEILN